MANPGMCKKTIEIRAGELVSLAGLVTVELLHKTGRTARLQITAPREVTVEKKNGGGAPAVPSMANSHRS